MQIMILEPITDELAKEVINQIAVNTDDVIDVLIMSPGGSVFAGNAIIAALNGAPAVVNTRVIGLAASMAAVISQVGKVREIDTDATFNLHFGSINTGGTVEDHEKAIAILDSINKMMLPKLKGNLNKGQLKALLAEDRFMTAKEAVSLGFFNNTTEPLKAVALLNNENNMKTEAYKKVLAGAKAILGFEKTTNEDDQKVIDALLEATEKKSKEEAEARIKDAEGKEAAEVLTAEMVTFEEFRLFQNTYGPLMKSLLEIMEDIPTTEDMKAMIEKESKAALIVALKEIRSKTVAPVSASSGFADSPEPITDNHSVWNEKQEQLRNNFNI